MSRAIAAARGASRGNDALFRRIFSTSAPASAAASAEASVSGSKLQQLQSKACQASSFAFKHGSVYYKQLLEQNKQYIQDPATVEKCNQLSKQLLYTRLASIPSRYESLLKEVEYVKHIWKNRQELKVEDAGIAALFGLECFAWFCAGEIVGRGFTFTGYYV